jgi:SPP1 gp7 family putative phage head morphogenesis protein
VKHQLRPILHKQAYVAPVERELQAYLFETIFAPLFALLEEAGVPTNRTDQEIGSTPQMKNAVGDPVERALADQRIWYANGQFTGQFNAVISRQLRKLGATWDAQQRRFSLPLEKMPMNLRAAVAQSEEASKALHKEILLLLSAMLLMIPDAKTGITIKAITRRIGHDLDKQFKATVPENILSPLKIDADKVAESFQDNIDFYLKKFCVNQLSDIETLVGENYEHGASTKTLARIIEARWGIAQRKANFLADQETSLMVAEYRIQTYKSIGSTHYVWRTRRDDRVRPTPDFPGTNNHRVLESAIFPWDKPPVVDRSTGRRCHPGQDFGCRCVPLPIIDLPNKSVIPQLLSSPWAGTQISVTELNLR